jgi:hypothetical protein
LGFLEKSISRGYQGDGLDHERQTQLAVIGQGHALQDKDGLLHILGEGRELGLGLGLVRTRSTEWTKGTGTTRETLLTTVKSTSTKSPRSDLMPSPLSDMELKEQV